MLYTLKLLSPIAKLNLHGNFLLLLTTNFTLVVFHLSRTINPATKCECGGRVEREDGGREGRGGAGEGVRKEGREGGGRVEGRRRVEKWEGGGGDKDLE